MSKFDEIIERRGSHCGKYDGLGLLYGNPDLLPMWVADMDFYPPKEVVEAIEKRAHHGVFGYSLFGSFYREAPVKWHQQQNDITYKEDSIFFTSSILKGLNLAVIAFTEEGDNVLLSMPSYGPFVHVTTGAKRNWIGTDLIMNGSQVEFDFEDFETKIINNDIKLYVLCNPHNPTGRIWTEDEIEKMMRICQKHNVLMVSDEVHSDLIMPGHTFVPAMKVARKIDFDQSLCVLIAPTKTFNLAGIQVAYYIVENEVLLGKIKEAEAYTHSSDLLNNFSCLAMEAAYEHGATYVKELTEYVYGNYKYMRSEIERECPQVVITDLQATYLVWLNVDYLNVTEDAMRDSLVAHGLALETSKDFFEHDKRYMRVNIACPRETVEKGTKLIIECLKDLEK